MISYARYKHLRDASWHCLLDTGISRLPVSLSAVANSLSIRLCGYMENHQLIQQQGLSSLLSADGFSYADASGHILIFFDDKKSEQEIRYTIAHELGHILLGHVGASAPPRSLLLSAHSSRKLEAEADSFALRLLSPACVLWGIHAHTAQQISTVCAIPPDVAKVRAARMAVLIRRGAWLTSPLEQSLYAQFQSYIEGQ